MSKADRELLDKISGWNVFERQGHRGEPGGFKFVCPGVMLGKDDVKIEIRDQLWHLSFTENDHTYRGSGETQVGAYLALIGDRWGLIIESRSKPEEIS